MYTPKLNEVSDLGVLHRFIEQFPLGGWTALTPEGLALNHIPFLLKKQPGNFGVLAGHVARANPIWRTFSKESESLISFQGPSAYISPSWYPSKLQHQKTVPTWNYCTVQAFGMPSVIDEPEWLLQHIQEQTDIHESKQALPWKVSDAPEDFIHKLTRAIVGIEIPIARIKGKFKLGQNRPEADQLGVQAGLLASGDHQAHALVHFIKTIEVNA